MVQRYCVNLLKNPAGRPCQASKEDEPMGLNLETLIGILVILILLILADGLRRMVKERRSRLRMRIDPRYRDADDADLEDDLNPELMGGPRVVKRSVEQEQAEQDVEQDAPPMMMEPDEAERPAPEKAEQQSLFQGQARQEQDNQPAAPKPETEPAADSKPEPTVAPRREPEPAMQDPIKPEPKRKQRRGQKAPPTQQPQPVLEVIVLHLIARQDAPFDGAALLRLLLDAGLRYGDMNIFHRHVNHEGRDELQFSMANAVEPGTFDLDTMESSTFAGVTFFLKLPGATDSQGSLSTMLGICRYLAESLGGELKDEQHSVMTRQTMEHLRQRVQEFERRQRVPSA